MEFLGDDGISYNLSELQNGGTERAGCIHSYVKGYVTYHYKYSSGGCKIDYYSADVCERCGEVIMKDYSHTVTSTKCTH